MPGPIVAAFLTAGASALAGKAFGGGQKQDPLYESPEFDSDTALRDLILGAIPQIQLRPPTVRPITAEEVGVGRADGGKEEEKKPKITDRITDAFLQTLVTSLASRIVGGQTSPQTYSAPVFK